MTEFLEYATLAMLGLAGMLALLRVGDRKSVV